MVTTDFFRLTDIKLQGFGAYFLKLEKNLL